MPTGLPIPPTTPPHLLAESIWSALQHVFNGVIQPGELSLPSIATPSMPSDHSAPQASTQSSTPLSAVDLAGSPTSLAVEHIDGQQYVVVYGVGGTILDCHSYDDCLVQLSPAPLSSGATSTSHVAFDATAGSDGESATASACATQPEAEPEQSSQCGANGASSQGGDDAVEAAAEAAIAAELVRVLACLYLQCCKLQAALASTSM